MGERSDEGEGTRSESAADPPGETALSVDLLELDHVYEALARPRRRYLCYTLLEDTERSLTDLATKIAAWENDVPESAVTDYQHEEVFTSLYHAHVPKLVESDVVEYDELTETIRPGKHAEQVLAALEGIGGSLDSNQETHAREGIDDAEE